VTETIDPNKVQNQETYRGLVDVYSRLPKEMLDTLIMVKAWHLLDETFEEGYEGRCTYCAEMLDGEDQTVPECEHWRYLTGTIMPAQWALWESVGVEAFPKLESCGPYYRDEPNALELPEGYYAVPDPRGVEEMTYWRRAEGNRGPTFKPWPAKARYGWVLYKKDRPELPKEISRNTYIRAYYETLGPPYRRAIVEAIQEDPVAAQQRFADWAIRCCMCGKGLTNDRSKVYGIGPECRKGMPSEVLANYFRPQVARVHAKAENS
jgi:Family of unknown function (DUF6011)